MLLEKFNAMYKMPIFEILNNDGEYEVYYIQATKKGLELGGVTNVGFHSYELETVEWNEDFSLDEHLEKLYEIAYNDAISEE